jgi:C1A family cysteine protease
MTLRRLLVALLATVFTTPAFAQTTLDLNRSDATAMYGLCAQRAYTARGRPVNTPYCQNAARRIVAGRPYAAVSDLVTRKIISRALYDTLRTALSVGATTPTPTTPTIPTPTPTTPPDLPFPAKVDFTDRQSPVRNQARRNTCVAFATTASVEAYDKSLDLSEQLLYYLLRYQDADKAKCERLFYDPAKPNLCDDKCSGATVEDSVKVLQKVGLFAETVWPYDRTDNLTPRVNCNEFATWASKAVSTSGKKMVKLGKVTWLAGPGETPKSKRVDDPMVVMAILARGYPVTVLVDVAGSGWGSGMHIDVELDPIKKKPLKSEGAHGLLIVGYDYAKKLFKFKNSWDNDWGEGGYGFLTFDYLKQYAYGGYYALGIVK